MTTPHGGVGASNFATAARILFDSARKVGAVEPLGPTSKRYAQQLKKIQSQSRKKGGSLGSVSYKVAEFLATQRTPKVSSPLRNSTSIARKVPLIDIPLQLPKKKDASSSFSSSIAVKANKDKVVPSLDFVIKKETPQTVQPTSGKEAELHVKKTSSHSESLLSDRPVPSLNVLPEKKKTTTLAPDASSVLVEKVAAVKTEKADALPKYQNESEATTTTLTMETTKNRKATIVEDKPIFEITNTTEAKPSFVAEHDVALLFEKVVPVPARPIKPKITVPISVEEKAATIEHDETIKAGTISVDAWELQREREIDELRKIRENTEKERLAMQREEEHKTLGDEWVQRRTTATTAATMASAALREANVGMGVIEEMFFSSGWESCLKSFRQLVAMPTVSATVTKQAVRIMEGRLRCAPLDQRDTLKSALLNELKKRRLPDEVAKFELRHEVGNAFLQLYKSAANNVKDSLDFSTVSKAVSMLAMSGSWEEAIELVGKSRERFTDKTGILELKLLLSSYALEAEAAKNVTEHVSKTLASSERLGKIHKVQMAKMEKGVRRRQMILQLISSSDVDEVIYAELLRITPNEGLKDVLDDIRKRGLNVEDPAILAVLCWKTFDTENPHLLFQEIEKQEVKTGIRPAHVSAAVAMARASKTKEVLQSTIAILKRAPVVRPRFTLRKLLPLLHENNMNKEIVELADLYKNHVPFVKVLPQAIAFVNDALQAEGRPPFSEHSVSSLKLNTKTTEPNVNATSVKKPKSTNLKTHAGVEISSEVMLQCAKDRNWMKALSLINSITLEFSETIDSDTLTLFYNCALSASVEKLDIVRSIYSSMKERKVEINTTTNNAVLSSMMRSEQSQETIDFYNQTSPPLRDTNTYSVILSLYGKIGKWEEAIELIKEAKTRSKKLPPIIYTLGINAVHNHSWSAALSLFQTLRKEHGSSSIKDVVVDKVIRCLSQNKRTAELRKLEADLAKMKKK